MFIEHAKIIKLRRYLLSFSSFVLIALGYDPLLTVLRLIEAMKNDRRTNHMTVGTKKLRNCIEYELQRDII